MLCSELEPRDHEAIYQFVAEKINTPGFSVTAKHLTYVIIRGSYTEFCVLFNVDRVNGPIVKNLKALAENLKGLPLNIVSSFIFSDPTRSDYYLDNKQTGGAWKIKNLFGPDTLRLRVGDQTYRFDPVSFSQVNQSMLPSMLDHAKRLCGGESGGRFIDLYCGYGLFANYIGPRFGEVYAVDYDAASVDRGRETARYSAKKNNSATRMYFRTASIRPSSLDGLLPVSGTCEESILLDPPRQGPEKGVIAFCADRGASRIIHLFCSVDRLPTDLQEWQSNGYRISEVVTLDMFPGTPNLEVMVLLRPFN
jgi:tRNA/tmRNA/rRNA uracil-C5-methylase (TrmA/RlmC/RlmD family)